MQADDPTAAILAAVTELARRNGCAHDAALDHRLTADLGLESLDIAELVAVLELELGADPFVESASIADAQTVGELVAIYQRYLAERAPGAPC
jgi:acyl carrier protein